MNNYKFLIMVLNIVLLVIVLPNAYAVGGATSAKIIRVGTGPFYNKTQCNSTSCALIAISPAPTGVTCGDYATGWHYLIDTSTAQGIQTYSAVLAAYSSGNLINTEGTGLCTLAQKNNIEELNFIQLIK